jgi:hypothetical protein
MYLDDRLIKNRALLLIQLDEVLHFNQQLRLIVNRQKSNMIPSQVIQYLGSVFDPGQDIVYPSEERYHKIVEEIILLSDNNVLAQSI